jgi:hypothetical protein
MSDREAVLVAENAGFDAHLQHHHCIILGDMNYRVCQPPRLIIEMVAWAAIQVRHPTHPFEEIESIETESHSPSQYSIMHPHHQELHL